MAIWRREEISFAFLDDLVDHPVVTSIIRTPVGRLRVMAAAEQAGRTLILRGLHIHGETVRANAVGMANLQVIAQVVMERMDYDALVIEGAVRTTGANPDHLPRRLRFARRPVAGVGR